MTLAADALAIFRAGVRGVDPGRAVRSVVRRRGRAVVVAGERWELPSGGRYHVIGLGKAAGAMADAAAALLGRDAIGVVAVPRGYPAPRGDTPVVWGNHPEPGAGSLAAGRRLLAAARATEPRDRLLFLISGGGSAVAERPLPPLDLDDFVRTTDVLLDSGAPIQAMNALRRHLSELKGGRLAVASRASRFATVAISDVVGDPPGDVASGPTVPDPTTWAEALRAGRRYRFLPRLPAPVRRMLTDGAAGRLPETPKPGDPRFRAGRFHFGATNRTALFAAARAARRRGYATTIDRAPVTGETQPAALRFARRLCALPADRRRAVLSGGETTVTLGPHPGRGGRNQEFALASIAVLDGRGPRLVLSAGTDGIDGPTDAAGGYVDDRTAARARARGVDVAAALARHAAYDSLARLGGLLTTGPTGTNVMDLHVGLVGPAPVSRGTGGSSRPRAAPSSRRRRS